MSCIVVLATGQGRENRWVSEGEGDTEVPLNANMFTSVYLSIQLPLHPPNRSPFALRAFIPSKSPSRTTQPLPSHAPEHDSRIVAFRRLTWQAQPVSSAQLKHESLTRRSAPSRTGRNVVYLSTLIARVRNHTELCNVPAQAASTTVRKAAMLSVARFRGRAWKAGPRTPQKEKGGEDYRVIECFI